MRVIGKDVDATRQVTVVASGTMSNGDTLIVNSDGTASIVAVASDSADTPTKPSVSPTNLGQSRIAYDSTNNRFALMAGNKLFLCTISGSTVTVNTGLSISTYNGTFNVTYDSTADKFLIVWQGSQNYGYARVATVSGTSFTLGTQKIWTSNITTQMDTVYHVAQDCHVVQYMDETSNRLEAVCLEISGTTVQQNGNFLTVKTAVAQQGGRVTYDSASEKVVGIWNNYNSAAYQAQAVVYTVTSGSTISKGTIVDFDSGNSIADDMAITYDSDQDKVVVFYTSPQSGSQKFYAVVGTVSSTDISFGTRALLRSSLASFPDATYDPVAKKCVVAYDDNSSSSGRVITGQVSGTSFGSSASTTFDTDNVHGPGIAFSSTDNVNLIAFRNNSDSQALYTTLFTAGATNLTADNYIGTAKSGAADGSGVTVNAQGSVDDNQTGLTAGQSYYVSPTDGSLSTTPGDPSVFAGTAVSATKLIVKG